MTTRILALFIAALAAAVCAQETHKSEALTPALHPGTQKKIDAFNEISKKGEAKLVFLGDSITEGWGGAGSAVWEATWAPMKAANFGIGGDRTEHVLWRLDHGNLDGLRPKLVVLMIGTNNTGHRSAGEPAGDTAAGVKAIVEKLRSKVPAAKILLLGVFPREEKPDGKLRRHNEAINALLSPLADNKAVFYMDIGKSFLQPDGTLNREVMPDVLHLSPKGYQIWADAIKAKVTELMK